MEALRSFETSVTTDQSTGHDIPEYLNFQQQNIFYFFKTNFVFEQDFILACPYLIFSPLVITELSSKKFLKKIGIIINN
jgi:hypothetical protein